MRALSATELLDVWERGEVQTTPQRALTLLATACPDIIDCGSLTIGHRDRLLFELRNWAFGSQLTCLANCPGCGEKVEAVFPALDVITNGVGDKPPDEHVLETDDYEVGFRLPICTDLTALKEELDVVAGHNCLFERCVAFARQKGVPVAPAELPDRLKTAVIQRMAQLDPHADVRLDMRCPSCDRNWEAPFDIVTFLWTEIQAWALRTLRDVHTLASVYGWSEAEILALHPTRRQRYLELIGRE